MMRAGAAALLLLTPLFALENLTSRAIFGSETPTGKYKHPASIAELDNGDLLLTWYGGDGEYAPGTAVWGSRFRKGNWSKPRVLAQDPFRSVGNPVIWQAPDKTVWLFYVVRFGDTWSSSRIALKVSRDNGETWSDSHLMTTEEGLMVRSKPVVLANGDYILPVYRERGEDRESVSPDTVSLFFVRKPGDTHWKLTGAIKSAKGNLQPAVAEISSGHLIAYCRRGGGYGPEKDGFVVFSESRDGGQTWTPGRNTEFPNPNAAVDLVRLQSGRLMLVYNDSQGSRTPLSLAFSSDAGKTWPVRSVLAEGRKSFGYPYAIQTRDKRIHVIYTIDRTTIQHAIFDEPAN